MNYSEKLLAEVRHLKQEGRLVEAEAACRRLLLAHPNHPEGFHQLGALMHLSGKSAEAIEHLIRACDIDPSRAEYRVTLGGNLAIVGRIDEAEHAFSLAAQLDPTLVTAHFNLGLAKKHLRKYEEAIEAFNNAIRLSPAFADAYANKGFCEIQMGAFDAASQSLFGALTYVPNHPLALTSLAHIESKYGSAQNAHALQQGAANNASESTFFQLGTAYLQLGQQAAAMKTFEMLVSKFPSSADGHSALAMLKLSEQKLGDAYRLASRALELSPTSPGTLMVHGSVCAHLGLVEEAKDSLSKSFALRPLVGARVQRDLLLPAILESKSGIATVRREFEENLHRLVEDRVRTTDPFLELGFVYFFLAYHGEDDLALLRKIADFYLAAAPMLAYRAPHVLRAQTQRGESSKPRIGFYSRFIYKHSVSVSFSKIVEHLAQSGEFEIFLISDSTPGLYDASDTYPSLHTKTVRVKRDTLAAREQISSLQLDMLVYLDMGMDPLAYQLAFSRLAHIQCVMAGHPVTSGLQTLDYFFSPDGIEPADGESHYSETLVRLEHGGYFFERPNMPARKKRREELCLPTTGNVYFCPMMLQKIHPDFDEAIERILRLDPSGNVVFVESGYSSIWTDLLQARLRRTLSAESVKRVSFIPWLHDTKDLISVIQAADVILDTFHFGIGTTGIFVFAAGAPLVTLPSRFARGRVGYYYCRLLGIDECIATDARDYASRAVTIASDKSVQQRLRERVLAANYRLFENPAAPIEFAHKIRELLSKRIDPRT